MGSHIRGYARLHYYVKTNARNSHSHVEMPADSFAKIGLLNAAAAAAANADPDQAKKSPSTDCMHQDTSHVLSIPCVTNACKGMHEAHHQAQHTTDVFSTYCQNMLASSEGASSSPCSGTVLSSINPLSLNPKACSTCGQWAPQKEELPLDPKML